MNTVAIDSCSLVIPISKCTSISAKLQACCALHESNTDVTLMSLGTGEILKDIDYKVNASQKVILSDGTETHYRIENRNIGSVGGVHRKCIVINLSSKLLGSSYLAGITSATISALYDSIIQQNVIALTYSAFVGAFVTDVDVKKDYPLPSGFKDFEHLVNSLYAKADNQMKKMNLIVKYNKKDNQGIQWGYRGNAAKLPFFKIYNKVVELDTQSLQFKTAHNISVVNPVRFEFTCKNKPQLLEFGLLKAGQSQTLQNVILNAEVTSMQKLASRYINIKEVKPLIDVDKLVDTTNEKLESMTAKEAMTYRFAYNHLTTLHAYCDTICSETLVSIMLACAKPNKDTIAGLRKAILLAYKDFTENTDIDASMLQEVLF